MFAWWATLPSLKERDRSFALGIWPYNLLKGRLSYMISEPVVMYIDPTREPKYCISICHGDILCCYAVWNFRWLLTFRKNILLPSSWLKVKELRSLNHMDPPTNPHAIKTQNTVVHIFIAIWNSNLTIVMYLLPPSTLMMDAASCIPEDSHLYAFHRETPNSQPRSDSYVSHTCIMFRKINLWKTKVMFSLCFVNHPAVKHMSECR